ncbi:DUF4174 domain-containing protein [Guyparkeria halophila]|uniref:DUF4174 domain-containing protein n=1 Tax=Guyparkeria halophila TaxID=47960 RepID=A0ABZ0YZM0_9GAMM|nr:DUF4174 domain-containing protein [Guyparkeria halophila]WQH17178.1 DUF4174 domain-containing protein [Guyparkeria halophila]
MSRLMRFVPTLACLAATAFAAPSIAWAANYWDKLEWQVRPLVLVEGGSSADNWTDRLLNDRCALAERRIHWLVIEEDGAVWRRFDGGEAADFESTRLDEGAAASVRDRVGWSSGDDTRLLLFGLDGQRKYSGRPDALETIWALIDRMPMRRNELAREPDDCASP